MPFQRQWDESCPRVWDYWEVGQKRWIIQDLDPADDEQAVNLLLTQFATEEVLSTASDMINDERSMQALAKGWARHLSQRMSLGCYVEEDGKKMLAAVNCCTVEEKEENIQKKLIVDELAGALLNLLGACNLLKSRVVVFELLNTNKLLSGRGLVVRKEYRGGGVATRVLAARKPLCLTQGITATDTVFTNAASQRSAEKAGFVTIATASLKELAENGLKYSKDDDRVIKYMVNNFKDTP